MHWLLKHTTKLQIYSFFLLPENLSQYSSSTINEHPWDSFSHKNIFLISAIISASTTKLIIKPTQILEYISILATSMPFDERSPLTRLFNRNEESAVESWSSWWYMLTMKINSAKSTRETRRSAHTKN